jgi:hypothetical protein
VGNGCGIADWGVAELNGIWVWYSRVGCGGAKLDMGVV